MTFDEAKVILQKAAENGNNSARQALERQENAAASIPAPSSDPKDPVWRIYYAKDAENMEARREIIELAKKLSEGYQLSQ